MKANGKTVVEILSNLPEDRVESFNKLHDVIVKNMPEGFEAAISYGGLGYVVPCQSLKLVDRFLPHG